MDPVILPAFTVNIWKTMFLKSGMAISPGNKKPLNSASNIELISPLPCGGVW